MNKASIILFFVYFTASTGIWPQQLPTTEKSNLSVSLTPVFKSWEIENEPDFYQISSSLIIDYNFLRYTNITFHGAFGSTSGDVDKLDGFSDSQIALSQKFEKINLILDAGINIPNGHERMNEGEFATSRLVGQDVFDMRISNFGQGLNFHLGGLWVFSAGRNIALGIGASYQMRGEYEPYEDDSSTYKPSDEILITAGADFSFTESNSFSIDATAIIYGSDKLNDESIFDSGNRMIITAMYRQFFGLNSLHILAGYRHQELSSFNEEYLVVEDEKVNPDNFFAMINYIHSISDLISLGFSLKGNFYETLSAVYSGYNLFEYGLMLAFNLTRNVQCPVNFKFMSASSGTKPNLLGYELGFGLKIAF